jgi:hypothetical protein
MENNNKNPKELNYPSIVCWCKKCCKGTFHYIFPRGYICHECGANRRNEDLNL